MNKKEKTKELTLRVKSDKQVIAKGKTNRRILEIVVIPPTAGQRPGRPPLNLSLVLDRSGSMSGEKLHYAKQAAEHVVDLLEEQDRTSIVIYDDDVTLLFPSAPLTDENKTVIRRLLAGVHAGSSTFLSGGWLKGCEQVAECTRDGSINRTLLLSDGLANRGITDSEALAAHASEIFERGVSTSCFGVGRDYDEHLLEAMSNHGGGNFHFIEAPASIPVIFEREFKELANVTARDVEVTLSLPKGVKAEVLADWRTELKDGKLRISLGSLYSGREQAVYLRLDLAANAEDAPLVIPVLALGKGEGNTLFEQKGKTTFKVVDQKEEKAAAQDEDLMKRYAAVDLADQANKALKEERSGDRFAAHNRVAASISANRPHMSQQSLLKYQFMASAINTGLSPEERKRRHHEEYMSKRQMTGTWDHKLTLENGHLVAHIDGMKVLIDSGVPISVGNPGEWYYADQVHQLSPDFMGVTVDVISGYIGSPVDILMGTDILKKYCLVANLAYNRVEFHDRIQPRPGIMVPLEISMGVPTVRCAIGKDEHGAYIDTGAKLSYVGREIATGLIQVGEESDFFPGLGEFQTPVYEVPLALEGITLTLRCGVLPELLEQALWVTGMRAIIGAELFQKFTVSLAIGEKAMWLSDPRGV